MSEAGAVRIAIYGAGSIGCYLGGRLDGQTWSVRGRSPRTARVRFLVRPAMSRALRERGLVLSDWRGYRRTLAADALDLAATPAEALAGADLVLVTVKSPATPQVAAELAAHLPPQAWVISFQNGLHNAGRLRATLPGRRVLAGMVPFNVVQREPGAFHQGSSGTLVIDAHADQAKDDWPALFAAAGLPLRCSADMPAVQQAKLLLNLNNALNALSDLPLREELAQRAWRRCLALAQREALRVYAAAGMRPARLTPVPAVWLPRLLELPDALFRRLAARMLAIDPLARSSTWEDLRAGRPTEVGELQGEVVALGRAHGVATPVNARLLELVREAERAPRAWRGETLLAALRETVR